MKRFFKKLVLTLLIGGILGSVGLGVWGYAEYKNVIGQKPIEPLVAAYRDQKHYTQYADLPKTFVDAVIATEDARYWSRHTTLDFEALGRAMFRNLKNWRLVEGGSTIPQQIAKNLYYNENTSIIRKISEWFIANDLLKTYNKNDLFALYANMNYYGDGFNGIYSASMGYFKKKPSQLSDGQASLLAGIPQAPAVYQLSTNFKGAKKRQFHVLERMKAEGYLDENAVFRIYNIDVYGE